MTLAQKAVSIHPRTLVEALTALPDDDTRGLRLIGIDRSETYYSFADLGVEAQRCARQWMRLGLSKGSPVALILDDNRDFVRAFLGAAIAGLVPVPIHPRTRFKRLAAYSDAVVQIVEAACTRAVIASRRLLPIVESLVGRKLRDGSVVEWAVAAEDLMALDVNSNCALPTIFADDICFLQFTSGSQSAPKGVCVTHANIMANAKAAWGASPGLDRNDADVAISWLPLFHDMGLIGFVLGPIACNVSTVLLPTEAFSRRPAVWLETISRYRGTITFAPNFAYAMATKHVRDQELPGIDLSSLRIAGCGAEPINADVMRAFAKRFAAVGFRAEALTPTYGMAEATLAVAFHAPRTGMVTDIVCAAALREGKALEASTSATTIEVVSCGRPLPGTTVGIVDDDGLLLPERSMGEIVIRGPCVSPGYFRDTDATTKTFRSGWLHTGDLGYFADGNLYICGRAKDLIIINGAKYHPQDIEWTLAELPGVRLGSAVAFGVSEAATERLVIAVEGIFKNVEETVASVTRAVTVGIGIVPHAVAIAKPGSLPKTTSGKLQRQKTKDLYCAGELLGMRTQ